MEYCRQKLSGEMETLIQGKLLIWSYSMPGKYKSHYSIVYINAHFYCHFMQVVDYFWALYNANLHNCILIKQASMKAWDLIDHKMPGKHCGIIVLGQQWKQKRWEHEVGIINSGLRWVILFLFQSYGWQIYPSVKVHDDRIR